MIKNTNFHIKGVDTDAVLNWYYFDICPKSKEELAELVNYACEGFEDSLEELYESFNDDLKFGTAGLRGKMGVGPNRMNKAVVAKTTRGICDYLRSTIGTDFRVVIGYDGRHNSKDFAQVCAEVVAGYNAKAYIMPQACPTPTVVYAAKKLNADITIVITASHNPAQDNGYKVYLGKTIDSEFDGAQIVSPFDKDIYACIKETDYASDIARRDDYSVISEKIIDQYKAHVLEKCVSIAGNFGDNSLKIVTTAMHGVGGQTLSDVLSMAGFKNVFPVAEQFEPNPDFPTVDFPNPEEKGALDLAFKLAKEKDADIILANDPDADRCSVAIKTINGYRQLTGDEIGSLLGNLIASQHKGKDVYMANSIVSSRLLELIAKHHGLHHTQTLTGFKWISRTPRLVFGYEEAIGFCIDPETIRDKDGISACLLVALYADFLKSKNMSLQSILDTFALLYGFYATDQLSIRVEDTGLIDLGMRNITENPPQFLAGSKVVKAIDLFSNKSDLPPTTGMLFVTENNDRIIIRPSGTEPKLKCYIETVIPREIVIECSEMGSKGYVLRASKRIDQLKADIKNSLKM